MNPPTAPLARPVAETATDIVLHEPVQGPAAAAVIASVYFQCLDLLARQEHEQLVAAADTLSLFTKPSNANSTRLFSIRLWRFDAMVKLGRGKAASDYLLWMEQFYGPSHLTRHRKAKLASYLGRYEACVEASTDALLSLPLEQKRSLVYRELCQLRVEALIALGRHEEGRAFMLRALEGATATFEDLSMLRRTVNSPEALETFFSYLSPYFSFPGQRARHALYLFSVACRDNGAIERAIYAARQRFLAGVQLVGYGEKEPRPKENWTRDAAGALLDLKADLAAIGVEFFLVSGTLLGCVREGGIIGHDKDIDVGVLAAVSPEHLRRSIGQTGRFKVKPLTTDKLVQVQHANGVMIDVFLHWREDGRILHEGQKTRWWNSDFDLQEAEFLGARFLIPTEPERYLAENYGPGWRTPEPEFETFVDTPNMIVADSLHLVWYFYSKMFDYYYAGKPLQFGKCWKALKELGAGDSTVAAAVQRVLADAKGAAGA